MPKHNHDLFNYNTSGESTPYMTVGAMDNIGLGGNVYTIDSGNSQPHNNMPPYLVVYMWKRTA